MSLAAAAPAIARPVVRRLGRVRYEPTWETMRFFNQARGPQTPDEIWLLEHEPVFTLGLAGRHEHVLDAGDIPVVHCDRGGQVTYHGPGQLVAYLMLDLRRRNLGVKELVRRLEQSLIGLLQSYGVRGERRPGMPGVYVDRAKIAAVGLRIANGCSYHGVSLNVDLDLAPYARIDACGYPGLATTRLADLGIHDDVDRVGPRLLESLEACLIRT
ncbi:MAG TPA: lipoyl(octanoyl) transferase LipB [Usitatibacter sp.]|jgi:lipoyl(octanoyl) transferase|nr:lipoyl(octanoyl) transferase LipB [Usitatibacter sp.]